MKLAADWDHLKTITLSRRNLEGLIAQLDNLESSSDSAQIMRRQADGSLLIVVAEENAQHYDDDEHKGRAGWSGPGQVYGEQVVGS